MNLLPIDDPDDPDIVAYLGLSDEALRRQKEGPGGDLNGIFICEGARVTTRALNAGYTLRSILIAQNMLHRLPDIPDGVPVYVGSPNLIERVVGFRFHRGFVAAFGRPSSLRPDEVLNAADRILICENMTDATNLGVTIRSAGALGFDGLLLDPTTCDPLYRRTIRVSMGTVFTLPHARLDHLPASLEVVRDHGFRTVGLTPHTGSSTIGSLDRTGKIALVLGAEGPGLSARTEAELDQLTHIPMTAGIDSLNVGAAAAIAAYVIGGLDVSG